MESAAESAPATAAPAAPVVDSKRYMVRVVSETVCKGAGRRTQMDQSLPVVDWSQVEATMRSEHKTAVAVNLDYAVTLARDWIETARTAAVAFFCVAPERMRMNMPALGPGAFSWSVLYDTRAEDLDARLCSAGISGVTMELVHGLVTITQVDDGGKK